MDLNLFREASLKKMLTPEEDSITDYVKNIHVKAWLILLAIFILLVSILIFIFTAKLPNKIELIGLSKENKLICYLSPEAYKSLAADSTVKINNTYDAKISNISSIPLSKNEVESTLKLDYYKSNITLSDWNMVVTITCDTNSIKDDKLYNITITNSYINLMNFFKN
ncbi:hypothetical protein FDF50_03405 [Clostridium botulinum]|uniref:Uncharacterized protein n=1 Tax=Clostridium botulinum TaxID=1491 RepID=A0A6G4HS61_CLOBO|nr:hypothetical protein [Clostridium botulinum]MBD5586062.1 hypothetical protein [Clostridium botulinum]NFJ59718.1 hypothetical protein [Clostridium botulinum]NFJ67521.1 hypothetical protein [Clostridium botulinum]NFM78795.1 hypothetical protein [Clostridium botulinum]NFQ64133.1 hypothetical protein [Clostridium botulinum]